MATTGTISNTFRTGYALRIVWTVDSQSVANNTSTVTAKVQLVSLGSSYTINSSASKTGTLTINGTAYSFDFTAALSGSQTKTIFTKTVTVAHGSDGSKSCTFSASAGINVTLSGTYYGTVSASGKGTFNTIARATVPTVSATSVNMGESITINMPRAASTFVHTLTYKFGSATGTIGSSLGTSKAWTVPLSLASQIPNGTSGTCTITCQTYNGSTLVGSKTVSFTAKVPSSVIPTFNSVSVADTNTNYATQFASLVQNKSKAKFTINAVGAYGSTIKAYKTVIEGKTYTGATPTTAVLTTSGNVTAKVTVTDSRGRTATTDKTFYLIPYTAPKITTFEGFRSDGEGAIDYEGLNANLSIAFSIATANDKNTAAYKVEYRKNGDSAWTSLSSGNSFTLTENLVTGAIFSLDNAFEIRLSVTDYFATITKTFELPTAFTLLDFNASGRGVAFGKVSELAEGVEFQLPAFFNHAETPSSVTYLDTGQDLNELLTPGFYSIPNTAVSASILNKPWEGNPTGSIVVLSEGNSSQRVQIAHRGTKGNGCIYERTYYQSAWGDWQVVHNGGQKVLWSGGYYMTATHTITLSEKVSEQTSGIVLVFSRYSGGTQQNYHWNHFFISKEWVRLHGGTGCSFILTTDGVFGIMASKYLYIHDDKIGGNDVNNQTGTAASGITYNNAAFVLRYVIGV